MKLLFVDSSNADMELISYLSQISGLEVQLIRSSQLDSVRNAKTPEAKLQAFQSLLDGNKNPVTNQEDDADWSKIDNLSHNQEIDSNNVTKEEVDWETIDKLPHNQVVDSN